jgi:uncharacterized membrane protein
MNRRRIHIRRSITIAKSPEQLYTTWRNEERLAQFMAGAESVKVIDNRSSHWKVRIPGMGTQGWKSEITDDRENQNISWRTVGETKFEHRGGVRFIPLANNSGTEVLLELELNLPGGSMAHTAGRLFGLSPEDYVSQTLRNFKQLMETGEIASNKGPHARMRLLTGIGPKVAMVGAALMTAATFIYLRGRRVGGEA